MSSKQSSNNTNAVANKSTKQRLVKDTESDQVASLSDEMENESESREELKGQDKDESAHEEEEEEEEEEEDEDKEKEEEVEKEKEEEGKEEKEQEAEDHIDTAVKDGSTRIKSIASKQQKPTKRINKVSTLPYSRLLEKCASSNAAARLALRAGIQRKTDSLDLAIRKLVNVVLCSIVKNVDILIDKRSRIEEEDLRHTLESMGIQDLSIRSK